MSIPFMTLSEKCPTHTFGIRTRSMEENKEPSTNKYLEYSVDQ